MQPGESRTMRFTVKTHTRGFENSVTNRQIMQEGTFFNSGVVPQIGYQPTNELDDRNKRKRLGLKEKDLMPPLERNCTADCSGHLHQQQFGLGECGDGNQHFARPNRYCAGIARGRVD
jgi:hypothetical protein